MTAVCVLLALGLWFAIPAQALRARTVNARFHWPERTVKTRVKVEVSGGAFRDGTVQYETEERVPAGAPLSLKALSFVQMLFGQLWPFCALYVAGAVLMALLYAIEGPRIQLVDGLLFTCLMASSTVATRSGWMGSTALLEGQVSKARAHISRAIAGYGLAALAMASWMTLNSFRGRGDATSVLVTTTPLVALMSIAYLQRLLFDRHSDGLLEAQGQARFSPLAAAAVANIRADVSAAASPAMEVEGHAMGTVAQGRERSG